ncbi:putative bifunctional diguanylate cyclase/phosphodiesterase [Methylobacterium sp. SD21]|uniref:putative bifunctional diguanylate cyclase/phosphodiesterase n=1 Tax=Methylobacterium litchii TaxID=3138810 RepID=UPI00313F2096
MIAQVEAFRRRVPILYAVLSLNTVAVAAVHYSIVSPNLSVYTPGAVVAFMLARGIQWYRVRQGAVCATQARRMLGQTTILGIVLALSMLSWSCFLYGAHHDAGSVTAGITRRGYVVLYVGLTVICCISLLMHVRLSALVITVMVILPFSGFLMIHGSLVERAVAINLTLVAAAMLYVLFVASHDFATLVRSRSELQAIGVQQEQLANTDSLTGLSNRRQFFAAYEEMMARGDHFALFSMDLDGFKQVNDVHGHPAGDIVLAEIALRITSALPEAFCVARVGGDEFCVLHPLRDLKMLTTLAENIISACGAPIPYAYGMVAVGISVGISEVDQAIACTTNCNPIERADYALAHVKRSGKGRYEVFAPSHELNIRRRAAVEQALRAADLGEEIHLVYQPIVDAVSNKPIGYEALARWHSPILGDVMPAEFVPIAEQCERVQALTRIVVAKALDQARTWPSSVRIKINLSARDIADSAQMLRILQILSASAVSPSRVTFELTETAFGDLETISASVALIRAAGTSLAIDDFGIGYSSLSYVHRLEPNLVKIDRSFVQRLGCDRCSESIVKTMVELCRNIGARSLAEGVETIAQRDKLLELGVQELQGFLFARPMAADKLQVGADAVLPAAVRPAA